MRFTEALGLTAQQAIIAWLAVFLLSGVAGVVSMLLCHLVMSLGAEDSAEKHGISKVKASRVGGFAVVTFVLFDLGIKYFNYGDFLDVAGITTLFVGLFFFAIGAYQDFYDDLSSRTRFLLMLCCAFLVTATFPLLVLKPVGINVIDLFLVSSTMAPLFTAVCLAFMPNAFNSADGANALASGIAISTLTCLTQILPSELVGLAFTGVIGCSIFLVFNLLGGRLYLGDGGAYFLGALCGLLMILASNYSQISVWMLLSIAFYPAADLLWSMGRRLLSGESAFKSDDKHFHSLFFQWLDSKLDRSVLANTLCGFSIAIVFSFLPLGLSITGLVSSGSDVWFFCVVIQWLIYVFGWIYLNAQFGSNDLTSEAKIANLTLPK